MKHWEYPWEDFINPLIKNIPCGVFRCCLCCSHHQSHPLIALMPPLACRASVKKKGWKTGNSLYYGSSQMNICKKSLRKQPVTKVTLKRWRNHMSPSLELWLSIKILSTRNFSLANFPSIIKCEKLLWLPNRSALPECSYWL